MQNFIKTILESQKHKTAFWLAISIFVCLALIRLRIVISGHYYFRFLVWNLFLAFVPYVVSTATRVITNKTNSLIVLLAGAALWLLFFPNAPYIVTDLFHLRPRADAPYWFDLLLIYTFAWTGLMLGFASLLDFHEVISNRFNAFTGNVFVVGSLLLSGFGIYLGRFERWNSWDVVYHPKKLAYNILKPILNPQDNLRVWFVTAAFSAFLIVGYYTVKHLGKASVTAQRRAK
jgi:uncharacterized membrane protein